MAIAASSSRPASFRAPRVRQAWLAQNASSTARVACIARTAALTCCIICVLRPPARTARPLLANLLDLLRSEHRRRERNLALYDIQHSLRPDLNRHALFVQALCASKLAFLGVLCSLPEVALINTKNGDEIVLEERRLRLDLEHGIKQDLASITMNDTQSCLLVLPDTLRHTLIEV